MTPRLLFGAVLCVLVVGAAGAEAAVRCDASGTCAVVCTCGAPCTTLDGDVGSCQPRRGSSECLCQPSLPDDLAALTRQLETVSVPSDDGDDTPPPGRGDDNRPSVGLRLALDELRRLLAEAPPKTQPALRRALDAGEEAWHHYAAGSADLSHLGDTADALRRAEASLDVAALLGGRVGRGAIERLQARLAGLARRMAGDLLRVADDAGASRGRLAVARALVGLGDLAAPGNPRIAVALFGAGLNLAANTITFDVALFEQNIANALDNRTVGHAFSIAYQGQLYQGGESAGLARTAADPPLAAQSPDKETQVASVSKTITAIVIHRLLEEHGLTPEAFVAPYLPSDWALGTGVDQLRFRHFMTHTSGFGQIGAKNSYENLRIAIATDVGSQAFSYSNANFGLMRVLAAGLQGIDPVDYGEFDAGALTTAAFLLYAQFLYGSIGVDVDCMSTDPTPTVQYKFPDDGTSGFLEPNDQLGCGGFGWFISANELAAVMTNLRNTTNLLSPAARTAMQDGYLGFMDPANYSSIDDLALGAHYLHAGDWFHDSGEMHSCVVAFPIQVEVSLVINSARGFAPSQCNLLETAFNNAWVAN